MRVVCTTPELRRVDLARSLGSSDPWLAGPGVFYATRGANYLVYEVWFRPASGVWVTLLTDLATFVHTVPLAMVEVVSPKASAEWSFATAEGGWVLGAALLREPWFGRFSDDDEDVRAQFFELQKRMEAEDPIAHAAEDP